MLSCVDFSVVVQSHADFPSWPKLRWCLYDGDHGGPCGVAGGGGVAILCSQLIIIANSYTAWGVHIDFYHLCLCFLMYQKKKKKTAFLQISHTLGRAKPFLAVFPALGPTAAIVPERLCQGAEWCDRKSINLCCVNSQLCHVQLYDLGQVIYFLCFTETLPKVTFGIPDSKTSV